MSIIMVNNPYLTHGDVSPWTTVAIGNTTGSAVIGTDIVHSANGGDVYPEVDDILFTYQILTGDFDVYCKVSEPAAGASWNVQDAGAGIICLENLTGTTPVMSHAKLWWHATFDRWYGVENRNRATNGGGSSAAGSTSGRTNEHYLRLTRAGNLFTTYWDSNADAGASWTLVQANTLGNMPSPAYVGFFSSPLDADFSEIDFDITFSDINGF